MSSERAAINNEGDDMDDDVTPTDPEADLAYTAWTIIANVSEGDWSKQTEEWQGAATRWRDQFHARLDVAPGLIEGLPHLMDEYGPAGVLTVARDMARG